MDIRGSVNTIVVCILVNERRQYTIIFKFGVLL